MFLWEEDADGPHEMVFEGRHLERFMDRIYLPAPCDELDLGQLITVNSLRRSLFLRGAVAHANEQVKREIAAAVAAVGPRDVLEWGCGYDSMRRHLLLEARLTLADIDPEVCRWQRALGASVVSLTEGQIPQRAAFDALISVFVFHFRIDTSQLDVMRESLRPTGWGIANVYRRERESAVLLASRFEERGLAVTRIADQRDLCERHEYWILGREGTSPAVIEVIEATLRRHAEASE